jgi:ADP-ribosyl-[dinitrogen reductase] hydrolase
VAIAHAIRTAASAREVYELALDFARSNQLAPLVIEALEQAGSEPPEEYGAQQGWVRIALHNAFYRLVHSDSMEEGVVETVMCGGDTDTNAAIAGALLGAVYGRDAIPLQWRRAVLCCRPMEELGRVRHPRPRPFWPVDALELAEGLVIAGERAVKR